MQQFYRDQRMDVGDGWSRHSARRVSSAQSLHGRDRLREALEQLGFPLL